MASLLEREVVNSLDLSKLHKGLIKRLLPGMTRMSSSKPPHDFRSEEKLIPVIRARLAEKLVKEGFRPKDAGAALNVTQAAVTQYLKGKRGGNMAALNSIDHLID